MITAPQYVKKHHAAVRTTDFVFNQLIPYIGNKRKLLPLIAQALSHTGSSEGEEFLDLFAGSGVVARFAKTLGYRVIANDWEPYSHAINDCYIKCSAPPRFANLGGYPNAVAVLNRLEPRVDWVTTHLCPSDDIHYDPTVERMFYMRKNGMRIDAIRHQILQWMADGAIDEAEQACLLAPLLYQACYTSNTSGVFKGFHKGWGGHTGTALYRIAGDLRLAPAVFFDNKASNEVFCDDAQKVAETLSNRDVYVAYLDPPYNQHPYGSNYHVLNSIALWDKPRINSAITPGNKSAIRLDWRTQRRSAYNHAGEAGQAYARLLDTIKAHFILTSYSTDGTIALADMLTANVMRGHVSLEMKAYKRYRVSSQRFSDKPMNIEFVIVLDTHRRPDVSVDQLVHSVIRKEQASLSQHPEVTALKQGCFVFDEEE